jgi:hypothetical protein
MQIPDELERAGMIPVSIRAAICCAYCSITRLAGRNAATREQLGVAGGADGTWFNVSDGRYSAGSHESGARA